MEAKGATKTVPGKGRFFGRESQRKKNENATRGCKPVPARAKATSLVLKTSSWGNMWELSSKKLPDWFDATVESSDLWEGMGKRRKGVRLSGRRRNALSHVRAIWSRKASGSVVVREGKNTMVRGAAISPRGRREGGVSGPLSRFRWFKLKCVADFLATP